jgi:hypothetical protein
MTTIGVFGVLTPNGPHEWEGKWVHCDGNDLANTMWRNYKRSYVNNLKGMVDRLMSERLWYESVVGKDFTMPTIYNQFNYRYSDKDPIVAQIYEGGLEPSMIAPLTDEATKAVIDFMNDHFAYIHSKYIRLLLFAELSLIGASAATEFIGYNPTNEEDDRVGINSSTDEYFPNPCFDIERNLMLLSCYEGGQERVEFPMDSDISPEQFLSESGCYGS